MKKYEIVRLHQCLQHTLSDIKYFKNQDSALLISHKNKHKEKPPRR